MRISDWSSDVCSSDLRKTRWCHGAGAGPRLAKSRPAWIVAGARSPPKRPGAAGGGIKMMTSNPGGRRPRVPALVAGGLLLLGCGAAAAQVVQGRLELQWEIGRAHV